ncbi:putative MFS family arabinose efflux permease [Herbihabitans rhizosphaerae]|uniref:Putative MFS family arabinose efflux permease n=1 Tax=Herbihabitans rhizosphaerae TaxID=1872711 RepID=A0A4Q7L8M1_9PSEU|nr:MFS transporter [Herbihabitans rhizosphaerae]RZS45011.1 putative MFS family arabinose efflux permease [Herbihabitans rhizosphaerae]
MSVVTGSVAGRTERLPREVWVLVAANFVIAVGYGIVAPALPTFAHSFNVSVTAASIVVSVFAVSRLVFAPASGRLLAIIGERKVYVTGLLIVAVTTGLCAFAEAYWHLLALRALAGIGSTMFTVSGVALLVHVTPPTLRGTASGWWANGFLLGNVTGPIIGGGLIAVSLRTPFLVYAGALIVAVGIAWWFLRHSTLIAAAADDDKPVLTVREAVRHRSYRAALASNFANGWTVFGVRIALVPLFVTEVLHRDAAFAGTAMAIFAAGNVVMLLVSGKLADSLGRKPLVLVGLMVSAGGTIWLGYTETVPAFIAATVLAGLGSGLLNPPQQATVADVVGRDRRGGPALATFQMAADLGAILGPVVAGALAQATSFGASFALTGALSVVAAGVWLSARETRPHVEPETIGAQAGSGACGTDEAPDLRCTADADRR